MGTRSARPRPGAAQPAEDRLANYARPARFPAARHPLTLPPQRRRHSLSSPQITVVITTPLRPERLPYLQQMHASRTRQTVPWKAVLVLDGADPDRVPAPVAADPRVRILALPRRVGAACARNFGLSLVTTEFVNWADDDDAFHDWSLGVRLEAFTERLGWVAGYSEDWLPDGSTRLWECPVPPGFHDASDVVTYGPRPEDTTPIGPTTILARTRLVRVAGGMGGLVQGEDYMAAVGTTALAPGVLLPLPVYKYRQHEGQMTRGARYDELELAARRDAHAFGHALRDVFVAARAVSA
ncbi:glycosyl transferase family protein [Streptomyces laurentii]|uniref:Glycosyl transferase family protein n=1 Tax=Streptomyces laurentii TaxID=39478 RepID=A0A160P981_STRLU|nr:glycosyl transferase family protein [Streptomyces laurentii]